MVSYFSTLLNIDSIQKNNLIEAAKIHDIGKLLVPRKILNKPDSLTREEFSEIKKHPHHGVLLLNGISEDIATSILHHHEKYDGTGYPEGLSGSEIPLGSRIISIFDSLDAMISKRCYSSPISFNDAFNEITDNSGKMYDPELITILEAHYAKIEEITQKYRIAA